MKSPQGGCDTRDLNCRCHSLDVNLPLLVYFPLQIRPRSQYPIVTLVDLARYISRLFNLFLLQPLIIRA